MTRKKRLGRGLESLLNSVEVSQSIADEQGAASAFPGGVPGGEPRGESYSVPVSVATIEPQTVAENRSNIDPYAAQEPVNQAISRSSRDAATPASPQEGDIVHLNVYEIEDNPYQPRREFRESELASLAESLKEHNILQPILVRIVDGRYQLISGERRLRAAIKANWQTIPARLRTADDRLVSELAIVENLQRKDLNAIEKALSFRRYIDEHGCTQESLASRLKIDRSTIANLIRLLDLPRQVQDAVRDQTISAGHARSILPLGDEVIQTQFTRRIIDEGISVRGTEKMVADYLSSDSLSPSSLAQAAVPPSAKRTRSSHVDHLETELKMALGTKVQIKQGTREKGQIVVHFANASEFERLKNLIGRQAQS